MGLIQPGQEEGNGYEVRANWITWGLDNLGESQVTDEINEQVLKPETQLIQQVETVTALRPEARGEELCLSDSLCGSPEQ